MLLVRLYSIAPVTSRVKGSNSCFFFFMSNCKIYICKTVTSGVVWAMYTPYAYFLPGVVYVLQLLRINNCIYSLGIPLVILASHFMVSHAVVQNSWFFVIILEISLLLLYLFQSFTDWLQVSTTARELRSSEWAIAMQLLKSERVEFELLVYQQLELTFY